MPTYEITPIDGEPYEVEAAGIIVTFHRDGSTPNSSLCWFKSIRLVEARGEKESTP